MMLCAACASEQWLLHGEFRGIETGAQQSDDDELSLEHGHVAYDEMQVAVGVSEPYSCAIMARAFSRVPYWRSQLR